MLLRPATPLAILLLLAFVLLLLSTLSTPIIKSIPLARVDGLSFGVFGYCKGNDCSGFRVGYSSDDLFDDPDRDSEFSLPSSVRHSLSSLLIVHPVAALLTLICFGLAAGAHFHSPSHSPRYLLGLLILLLPTLLLSLLAFLVDILLFVPHLQWGGWIVLAATIIITSSGIVTCAMRRTLVSRKARKRRIAENAEMNGESFYNRQNTIKLDSTPPVPLEPKTATFENPTTGPDTLPSFATFDASRRSPDDDRRPLNTATPPSVSPDNANSFRPMDDVRTQLAATGPGRGPYNNPPRDEYGNPIPPAVGGYGPLRRDPSDPRLRNQYSNSSMGSQRGGGQGYGPRGRGGYPPRGRGGVPYPGPRGPPPQGYMGGRGDPMGLGPRAMGRGGRGPPPGYPPQGAGVVPDNYGPYGQTGPGYGNPGPQDGYGYGPRRPSPHNGNGMRGPSPVAPPLGNEIEMQLTRSSPPPAVIPGPTTLNPGDGYGAPIPRDIQPDQQDSSNTLDSPTSVYGGQNSYVPARAAWAGAPEPTLPSLESQSQVPPRSSPNLRGPDGGDVRAMNRSPNGGGPNPGEHYYEDVEPRFAGGGAAARGGVPSILAPGTSGEPPSRTSFDDLPLGARSPAASETSHFTSVSQRGVNPRWRPPESEARQAKQERHDLLLASNPDFQLPRARGRGAVAGANVPPVPAMPALPTTLPGLDSVREDVGGRYPLPR